MAAGAAGPVAEKIGKLVVGQVLVRWSSTALDTCMHERG